MQPNDERDRTDGDGARDVAAGDAELSRGDVEHVLDILVKSLRAHQLYKANNRIYQQFISRARTAFAALWDRAAALELSVEKDAFVWNDTSIAVGDGRESLAFMFYKDGIRRMTFLPEFEDEVTRFLELLNRARHADEQENDLVTLLWEQDFRCFRYVYVDILADGLTLPEASEPGGDPVDRDGIAAEVQGAEEAGDAGVGAAPASEDLIRPEDLEGTLHFLDDQDLSRLRRRTEEEWSRDVRAAVLDALFDRAEDGAPERRAEILGTLRELLTAYLFRGTFGHAATIIRQLSAWREREAEWSEEQCREIDDTIRELSEPEVLEPVLESLEDEAIGPETDELAVLFAHLRPTALPVLFRAMARTESEDLRTALPSVIGRLAERHVDATVRLLESDDPVVAVGAARVVGTLRLGTAVSALRRLLDRDGTGVRLAAAEALLDIHTGEALAALEDGLTDAEREIRITVARGVGRLGYQPARRWIEAVLTGRGLREADLTEKIAVFEAYGELAGREGVAVLDRLLNGRRMLFFREHPEIRACAALALGRMNVPAARTALERAADASEPMVRRAVVRALSGEEVDA